MVCAKQRIRLGNIFAIVPLNFVIFVLIFIQGVETDIISVTVAVTVCETTEVAFTVVSTVISEEQKEEILLDRNSKENFSQDNGPPKVLRGCNTVNPKS